MEFTELGWRAGVMLAAAVAVIYLVVALFRLHRLGRRGKNEPAEPDTQIGLDQRAPAAESAVSPSPSPAFGEHLAWTRLETEVKELRLALASLQEEVANLRSEVAEGKAVRRVSPLYADAGALARRGYDARGIAEECGISVSEAELVLAMSNDAGTFDDEGNDGSGQPDRIDAFGR